MSFVVELEKGVWLARGKGDPCRTLTFKNARRYSRWQDAMVGLTWARKYRLFPAAKIKDTRRSAVMSQIRESEEKMRIKQKFDFVEGEFETDTVEMICMPDKRYGLVELALKAGMNYPVARIRLHSKDRLVHALEVFDSAKALGDEICKRWNAARESDAKSADIAEEEKERGE